jgi:hypothetical protein
MRPLAAALLLLALVAPAGAGTVDDERKAAAASLAPRLEALATWAHDVKLFRSRDRTYALLLRFVPDHAEARKWLKVAKGKDGAWKQDPRYKEPKDFDPKLLPDFEGRRASAVGPFADALAALLERSEDLTVESREALLGDFLAAAPDDARARRANGEVLTAGTWLLEETLAARKRRRAIEEAAAKALADVKPPVETQATDAENALGAAWTCVLKMPDLRVLGTPPGEEVERTAREMQAARPYLRSVFDAELPTFPGMAVYLFTSPQEGRDAVARDPEFGEEEREFAANLVSTWSPKSNHLFAWSADPLVRRDSAVRQIVGATLRFKFGVTVKRGWAWEGFGLYLTHKITGTRLTFFVRRSEYADGGKAPGDDLLRRLQESGADWMEEGRALLASEKRPEFRLLLGKDVNGMLGDDALYAYLLASYVLEGRPDAASRVLKGVNRGAGPDEWVRESLGFTVEGLERRLARWVEEAR